MANSNKRKRENVNEIINDEKLIDNVVEVENETPSTPKTEVGETKEDKIKVFLKSFISSFVTGLIPLMEDDELKTFALSVGILSKKEESITREHIITKINKFSEVLIQDPKKVLEFIPRKKSASATKETIVEKPEKIDISKLKDTISKEMIEAYKTGDFSGLEGFKKEFIEEIIETSISKIKPSIFDAIPNVVISKISDFESKFTAKRSSFICRLVGM